MKFWNKITGKDLNIDFRTLESRVKKLPTDFQVAWEEIKTRLWLYTDFTGRNLIPIFTGIVGMLEQTAADGDSIQDVFGEDINGFCSALINGEDAKSYRDKWRDQLNRNIAKKLNK